MLPIVKQLLPGRCTDHNNTSMLDTSWPLWNNQLPWEEKTATDRDTRYWKANAVCWHKTPLTSSLNTSTVYLTHSNCSTPMATIVHRILQQIMRLSRLLESDPRDKIPQCPTTLPQSSLATDFGPLPTNKHFTPCQMSGSATWCGSPSRMYGSAIWCGAPLPSRMSESATKWNYQAYNQSRYCMFPDVK